MDNVRRASNEVYFSTIDGRSGWKIVKETKTSRQIILTGNTESMLAGLLEKKNKFEELGVTVLGKKTKTGLTIEVAAK